MGYRAAFRCIAGCHGEHSLEQVIYRCPKCGDLLEVAQSPVPRSDIAIASDQRGSGITRSPILTGTALSQA